MSYDPIKSDDIVEDNGQQLTDTGKDEIYVHIPPNIALDADEEPDTAPPTRKSVLEEKKQEQNALFGFRPWAIHIAKKPFTNSDVIRKEKVNTSDSDKGKSIDAYPLYDQDRSIAAVGWQHSLGASLWLVDFLGVYSPIWYHVYYGDWPTLRCCLLAIEIVLDLAVWEICSGKCMKLIACLYLRQSRYRKDENSPLFDDSVNADQGDIPRPSIKNPAYVVWTILCSLLLMPFHGLSLFLTWFFIVPIPMAKANYTIIRALYTKPLSLRVLPDYNLASASNVVLCTYQAFNASYFKYNFLGMNIIFVNLFPVVVAVLLETYLVPEEHSLPPIAKFFMDLLCTIPITFYIGMAISSIAAQTNYMIGALLNASFGSMTELILYGSAIRNGGLDELVQFSVTGGLLSDMLLLPGLSMIIGGIKHKEQKFNPNAAGVSSLLLFVAVVGAFTPTVFYHMYGGYTQDCVDCELLVSATYTNVSVGGVEYMNQTVQSIVCHGCHYGQIDLDADPRYYAATRYVIYVVAGILPLAYVIGLVFTFFTHTHIFKEEEHEGEGGEGEDSPEWSLPFSCIFMLISTIMFGLLAENIVHVLQPTLHVLGVPQSFLGLTLIALVPAATEIVNAIKFALSNQINLSVEIGSASAIQISLIQMPFLIVLSAAFNGATTHNSFVLIYPLLTVFAVIMAVITFNYISAAGKTNYFVGAAMVTIYLLFIVTFYFIPDNPDSGSDDNHHKRSNVFMNVVNLNNKRIF